MRLELATRNIASSHPAPQGVVKIRNGPVGRGLSAVGANEDVHDGVFLTFPRVPREVYTHVHVHARGNRR